MIDNKLELFNGDESGVVPDSCESLAVRKVGEMGMMGSWGRNYSRTSFRISPTV
jgi:hypothetical protein